MGKLSVSQSAPAGARARGGVDVRTNEFECNYNMLSSVCMHACVEKKLQLNLQRTRVEAVVEKCVVQRHVLFDNDLGGLLRRHTPHERGDVVNFTAIPANNFVETLGDELLLQL